MAEAGKDDGVLKIFDRTDPLTAIFFIQQKGIESPLSLHPFFLEQLDDFYTLEPLRLHHRIDVVPPQADAVPWLPRWHDGGGRCSCARLLASLPAGT